MRRKPKTNDLIRLLPRDLTYTIHVSENWITNGHWVVRKSRVSNSALFTSQAVTEAWMNRSISFWQEMPEEKMLKVATVGQTPFVVSQVTTAVGKGFARLLTANNAHAWLNEEYLTKFGVRVGMTMYGTNEASAMADAPKPDAATLVLMPMRVDESDIEKVMHRYLNAKKQKAA